MSDFKIIATIAEGWRAKFLDQERVMLIHPDHQPRIVQMKTIVEGDILPRDTDEALVISSQLGGEYVI